MVVHDQVVIMALVMFFAYIIDQKSKWAGFIGYMVAGGLVLIYNVDNVFAAGGFFILVGSIIKLLVEKR